MKNCLKHQCMELLLYNGNTFQQRKHAFYKSSRSCLSILPRQLDYHENQAKQSITLVGTINHFIIKLTENFQIISPYRRLFSMVNVVRMTVCGRLLFQLQNYVAYNSRK